MKKHKGFEDINRHFLEVEEQMINEDNEKLNNKNINKNIRKVGK